MEDDKKNNFTTSVDKSKKTGLEFEHLQANGLGRTDVSVIAGQRKGATHRCQHPLKNMVTGPACAEPSFSEANSHL
jgi:hypothetical protein